MAETVLKNDTIKVTIDSHGAEMTSLQDSAGREYLWNADPAFWKRHAPVLFPLVGSLKDKKYRLGDQTYTLGQHGFARDMEFVHHSCDETECWYRLTETIATRIAFPYAFCLDVGYRVGEHCVDVMWRVLNSGSKDLYFSLGGHPAFVCPLDPEKPRSAYSLRFDTDKPLVSGILGQGGVLSDRTKTLNLTDGTLPISDGLFEEDALILEHDQAHHVALLDPDGKAYLEVGFRAPVFGIWSMPVKDGKVPPFVCIEPWYGRCDAENFTGSWEEREWGNRLAPNEEFKGGYRVSLL